METYDARAAARIPHPTESCPDSPESGTYALTPRSGSGSGASAREVRFMEAKSQAIEAFEVDYLSGLMRRARGNITHAAREAGVSRHHLRGLLRKRGLYAAGDAGREAAPNG